MFYQKFLEAFETNVNLFMQLKMKLIKISSALIACMVITVKCHKQSILLLRWNISTL